MDKLTDMQREMIAAGMVKKEDVDKYQENLSLLLRLPAHGRRAVTLGPVLQRGMPARALARGARGRMPVRARGRVT